MDERIRAVMPNLDQGACPTVLLRHHLPDNSSHVDWMMAREPEAVSRLCSFRIEEPLDAMATGSTFDLTRIGDHRPAYLDYEGEVSANLGRVTRMRRGLVTNVCVLADETCVEFELTWSATLNRSPVRQRVRLHPGRSTAWRGSVLEQHASFDVENQ